MGTLTKIAAKVAIPEPVSAIASGAYDVAKSIPREVWYALAALLLFLWFRGHYIEVGVQRCEDKQAKAQQRSNELQVKREAKRDAGATKIATATHQAAAKATTKTEEATRARHRKIEAVPVSGACVAPVGLPDLAPAVDAANAARRAAVPAGSYSRRQYRSMADGGPGADGRLGEGDRELDQRHARDPHAGTPAPSG